MSLLKKLVESSYKGNIGFHEMMQFYQKAPQHLIDQVESLINKDLYKQAWKIIQDYLDVRLVGSQFNEQVSVVLIERFKKLHELISQQYVLNPLDEKIGSGAEGVVFSMKDVPNRLIKYTQDELEVQAIDQINKHKFDYVAKYYGVLDVHSDLLNELNLKKPTFVIIMESLEPTKIQPHVANSLLAITNIVVRKVWGLYDKLPKEYDSMITYLKSNVSYTISDSTLKKLEDIFPSFKLIVDQNPLLALGIMWNALFYDGQRDNVTQNRIYNFISDVRNISKKDNLKGFSDGMKGIQQMLEAGIKPKDTHGGNLLYDPKNGVHKWIDIRTKQ